jgi:ferric-dicitrate binding protein FerR (iron transport regulator)
MPGRGRLSKLLSVLLLANIYAFAAGPPDASRAVGYIAVRGSVRVDQQAAPTGTVIYAGDVIRTGKASGAILNLHSRTAATLAENSEVALPAESPWGGLTLRRGSVLVRSEAGQTAHVTVSGTSVLIGGEDSFPALCRIALVGGQGVVSAERGRVEVRARGAQFIVPPGKSARLQAGSPQAAGQPAGKVSNLIPDAARQQQGQGPEVTLRLQDGVNWEDVVRTLKNGRVRIALLDGSFLNVGARSQMRITKHDPQSQQTEVELRLGHLRGEVVKLTKAGSSFQVKTQTAVIGVVGTVFTINALPHSTQVSCLDGHVTVTNINPAVHGRTELNAGQSTNVPATGPPSPPTGLSTADAVQQVAQTSAGGSVSPQVTQALQSLGATQAQIASTVAQVTTTTVVQGGLVGTQAAAAGASGVSAVTAGVAMSRAGDAQDRVGQAQQSLEDAVSAAEDANAAATDAANTATSVDTAVQTVIQTISPSAPGCGCVEP